MSINLQGANGVAIALNSGGLAISLTLPTFTNAAAIAYTLGGRFFSKAIVASVPLVIEPGTGVNPLLPQALRTLAIGESCSFAVILDAAGNFTVAQGDIVAAGQSTPVAQATIGKLVVGAIKVSANSAAFIPGTTALNAAGLVVTYLNLAQHPGTSI